MTLIEFLSVMQTSRHGIYPLIHIADYGTGSDIEGDFGYVDDVLKLKNDSEFGFLLDAEVDHVDFSKSVSGDLYLEIEVYSN
jgi:hypothetical protein